MHMEKRKFSGKTKEEAIQKAKEELQEIEVIEKREVVKHIKEYLLKTLKDMGFNVNIEVKNKEEVPKYVIFSDNDALLIGKNGKNLKALSMVVSQHLTTELGRTYKFMLDVNEYKEN